ncbi:MAG: HAD family phosphatase [Verrucomicrobiales bacterium]|nr:HAD family phosphatase [Verrucomicrobiales bacterium]
MIRHYVFDIGNVILKFSFGITSAKLATDAALPEGEIMTALQPLQLDVECGRLSTADFARAGMERIGYRGTPEAFIGAFQDIFTLNEPIADLVAALSAADKPLYLLSNTSEMHVSWFTRRYRVFDHFHQAIYSHEAGCLKPDAAIFDHTVEKLGIDPAAAVYIDDLPANVEAAAARGFRALVYDHRDHADFRGRFEALTGFSG